MHKNYLEMSFRLLEEKEGMKKMVDSIWSSVYQSMKHTTEYQNHPNSLDSDVIENAIYFIINEYKCKCYGVNNNE